MIQQTEITMTRGYFEMMRERSQSRSCIESEKEELAIEIAREKELEVMWEKYKSEKRKEIKL